MRTAGAVGLAWGLAFILLEAIQYVFFGHVFQEISSFLFGALVFSITVSVFVGWAALFRPIELRRALAQPRLLLAINLTATASWIGFLMSVQLIEPAVAYTIGSGAMPLTAWAAYRAGLPEGEAMRNRLETLGCGLIGLAMLYLMAITAAGLSGFVRGGALIGALGAGLALAEGALFTWLLILCQRLDRKGVGAGVVFGLRFPLYVATAALLAAMGFDAKTSLSANEIAWIVALGLVLIVPPLYALQRAVALISTLTISTLTALGPFIIFVLQMIEGRVSYSTPTLIGLAAYFAGAILAATGAVRATTRRPA